MSQTTIHGKLLYSGPIQPELHTVVPFEVCFEREADSYVAIVPELDEYGIGDTQAEALDDLSHTLGELFLSLERDQSRLSGDLLSVWARLKSHVTRIQR